jgi:hypothetical protein
MIHYAAGANNETQLGNAMLHARRIEARQAHAHFVQQASDARAELFDATSDTSLQNATALGAVRERLNGAKACATHWASTEAALGDACAALLHDDTIDPVCILGIRASWGLVSTLALSGVGAVGAALQILRSRLLPGV